MPKEEVVNTADDFEDVHPIKIKKGHVTYFKEDIFKSFLKIDIFDATQLGLLSLEIVKHQNVQNIINFQVQDLELDLEKAKEKSKRLEASLRLDIRRREPDLKVAELDAKVQLHDKAVAAHELSSLIRDAIIRNRTLEVRLLDRISYLYNVREDLKVNREPAAPIGFERLESMIEAVMERREQKPSGRVPRINHEH